MDSKLFLAPATNREALQCLDRAVLEGFETNTRLNFPEEVDTPVRVWGLIETILPTWKTIEEGDWILFYVDEDRYGYLTRIVGKCMDSELGESIRKEALGDDFNGVRDWDCLVFLDEPVEVEVSGRKVANTFGYGNNYPVRFIRVTEERWESSEFDSVEEFIDSIRA